MEAARVPGKEPDGNGQHYPPDRLFYRRGHPQADRPFPWRHPGRTERLRHPRLPPRPGAAPHPQPAVRQHTSLQRRHALAPVRRRSTVLPLPREVPLPLPRHGRRPDPGRGAREHLLRRPPDDRGLLRQGVYRHRTDRRPARLVPGPLHHGDLRGDPLLRRRDIPPPD